MRNIINNILSSLAIKILTTVTMTSALIGCYSQYTQSVPVPQASTISNTKTNIIDLKDINSTQNSSEQVQINQKHAFDDNSRSNSVELYSYLSTLMMRRIYQVVEGRFIIENNCLFFERHHYNKLSLLSPFFAQESTVELFPDKGIIELNGTAVKLGTFIRTSGNVKDEYKFYSFSRISDNEHVTDANDNPCFADKAIFMSGNVIQ